MREIKFRDPEIIAAKKQKLSEISPEEAIAEGIPPQFEANNARQNFFQYFKKINPEVDFEHEAWAYTFEVIK